MPTRHPSVLILEDEAIVAIDLESALSDAGYHVAHSANSCAQAVHWLELFSPDAAVLDIEVSDGTCVAVAETLVERRIPFIVFAGRSADEEGLDPVFLHGLWVAKPNPCEAVIVALASLKLR